ncbi:uncharacterized protein BDR25DRAFT_269029 [Lindgomyces ingoldianus]|uniref:Uncharacterized protein n=1 Tax=Lindgomyces ingoldianus TaxID=673940 RepID=A0ACB6QHP0_9PLEO|nr:uncharacterized protein BDR25DRAFT_269029 [Lindgomyces ingoldianus]KAF2466449.1 hypothetical protein BDR25DRAFT_269029 [Lindgomyces ingoldianus]
MSEELDPSEFVQRIRQLGEQRDQQDAERVRKLEEEIIQGRSERLARRAERARSLSPDKPNTPQSHRSAADTPRSVQEKAASTPTSIMDPPSQKSAREDSLQRLTGSPAQLLEDDEPKKPAPSAAALGRSGTLSWQRRPQSGGMRRPLSSVSMSADKVAASSPRGTPEPGSPAEPTPSRNQIAQSLGAKDPSWFKQTADRGIGSAAYRRNQDDNMSEAGSVSSKRQLPGMSRDSTAEPELSSPPPESFRSSSPSRASSVRGSAAWSNRLSTNTSVSGGDAEPAAKIKSALPVLDSQKFAPPSEGDSADVGEHTSTARSLAMSPAQGRISPERAERPPSPTKGMGGFVQSAMLKRSDSVNKRWSTQTPQSPSRQNSIMSNRGSVTLGGYPAISKLDSRPSSLSRENSREPSSRPGSSSSNLTITKDAPDKDSTPKSEFVKPALPHHNRSKSVASTFSEDRGAQDETSPPSPSKRWSPTKSSWLESALKKPEAQKPKQPPPQQPAWMTEINRFKQQRSSVDLGKGDTIPPGDTTSGRASPIKDIQLKPTAPRRSEPPEEEEPKETVQPLPKPKPVFSPKPSIAPKVEVKAHEEATQAANLSETPKGDSAGPPSTSQLPASRFPKESPVASPPIKAKPDTPPKKDFRGTLKSRQPTSEASKKDEVNEFQNVFGRLRKAETKNYVAPDMLKNNILRGKAGLTITGGPKPSVRRDEFKESLISQKSAMLAKAQETGSAALKKADSSSQETTTPEAIARRKALGRADSTAKPLPAREREGTPEAISRQKSLQASKAAIQEKVAPPPSPFASKEPMKSSKLADRFNPALAGILARGPSPMSANASASGVASTNNSSVRAPEEENKGPAPELTHMTKGRARGPKRRAPAAKQARPMEEVPQKVAPPTTVPLVKAKDTLPSNVLPQTNEAAEELPAARTPVREPLRAKPVTPVKSPELSKKVGKDASPEIPRKPSSIEMERKSMASTIDDGPKKAAQFEAVEPVKEVSTSPKVPSWRSSRPLPTVPSKTENQGESSATLREISVDATPEKVSQPEAVEPVKGSSSPKIQNWKSSRPLPAMPSKTENLSQPTTALREISPPDSEISPSKETQSPEKPVFSVKGATALWGRQSTPSSPAPSRSKSPIKLPTHADEQAALENAGLVRSLEPEIMETNPRPAKPKPIGLGLGSFGGLVGARSRESSPPKPLSAKAFPTSPPISGNRPQSEPFKASPMPEKASGIFGDFFDESPVTTDELPKEIDVTKILMNTPIDLSPDSKIRTLRKQIQEITGDGKLLSVPMQEDHVLYQDSMYLCIHVFGDVKGAKITEVYLWSGNGVAEATLEDAQLFGRNVAKQNQGKLIILRQGKETPNFFEALGGIVITRRGSQPASKEYMLCGRRHVGHIAFDEVDFSLKSLCSGFAYVISTASGKVFLWKGRGCSAEELSGARLMGMDLTPTGELIEIDEGSEPPELFDVFPPTDANASTARSKGKQSATSAIPRSAEHWRYKPSIHNYRTRLFKIEQHQGSSGWGQGLQVSSFFAPLLRRPSWQTFSGERPTERPQTPSTPKSPLPPVTTKVVEIMPFCQRDLEPEHIFVLDAFFEMYIIVGPLSRTQSAAFSTALMFAQAYSMTAAAEEDRPFIPVTTVVLEGVPRDMKAVFRFWDDALIPAAGLMRGKLGRGKSLRIVGLEKAIEATRQ